jgi:hypothetical protein
MDWDADNDQLLLIDGNSVVNIDHMIISITEVELPEGGPMARTVMILAHEQDSEPDAVDYTFQLSNRSVYQLFQAMANNIGELVEMGWIPPHAP